MLQSKTSTTLFNLIRIYMQKTFRSPLVAGPSPIREERHYTDMARGHHSPAARPVIRRGVRGSQPEHKMALPAATQIKLIM